MQRVKIYNDLLHLTGEWMNADMLNRETEDRHPLSFYLSLFFLLFFKGWWGLTSPPPPSGSATAYSVTGSKVNMNWWLGFWFLTPLSTIFQLYRGGQFNCWRRSPTCRKSLTNFIWIDYNWRFQMKITVDDVALQGVNFSEPSILMMFG